MNKSKIKITTKKYHEGNRIQILAMKHYFSKTIPGSFDGAIQKVTNALKIEGFGIHREFDLKATIAKNLDSDFNNYKTLGAYYPQFATKDLTEYKIGAMLPCHVIVHKKIVGYIEISAIDPLATMPEIENCGLINIATEIRNRLQKIIKDL